MSVRTKILGVVGTLLFMLVGVVFYALTQITKVGSEIRHIRESVLALSVSSKEITHDRFLQSLELYRAFALATQDAAGELDYNPLIDLSKSRYERLGSNLSAHVENARAVTKRVLATNDDKDVQKSFAFADQKLTEFVRAQEAFSIVASDLFRLLTEHKVNQVDRVLSSLTETGEGEAGFKARQGFTQSVEQLTIDSFLRAKRVEKRSLEYMFSMAAGALMVGLLLGLYVTRKIANPLRQAAHVAEEIGRGNAEVAIPEGSGGEIGALLASMKSMHESIQESERKLKVHAEKLEASNDELALMNEEIARSNAELEQFAYVASHDLQEPLRMVGSYTQLLARRYQGKLDDNADEFMHFIQDGITRMQGLIMDLLKYSRVGTKGKELEVVDSQKVFDETMVMLTVAVDESGAQVTSDPLPNIMADKTQLGQLLQNLIGNAIKFRGEKVPEIHISAERKDAFVQFSVRDNGIGIQSGMFERIFEIFQRLHKRGDYEGTGIGLAICKRIVERHGGKLWLESEEGEGTTFFFTLPAA